MVYLQKGASCNQQSCKAHTLRSRHDGDQPFSVALLAWLHSVLLQGSIVQAVVWCSCWQGLMPAAPD